jgi:hypothetical protein
MGGLVGPLLAGRSRWVSWLPALTIAAHQANNACASMFARGGSLPDLQSAVHNITPMLPVGEPMGNQDLVSDPCSGCRLADMGALDWAVFVFCFWGLDFVVAVLLLF